MMNKFLASLLVIVVSAYGCFPPSATNTITGGKYEPKTNTTDYFVFPLGSVSLPGRWIKERHFSPAGQQWFSNKDSIKVAIAFMPCDKYEFYKPDLKDQQFLVKFYEWESSFYSKQMKTESKIIESDSTKNYIIWELFDNKNIDTYFLFGFNKCAVHNYSISGYKWEANEKIDLLRALYLNKK
jgi:hypothetical protein